MAVRCPCGSVLAIPTPAPAAVRCPRCGQNFLLRPSGKGATAASGDLFTFDAATDGSMARTRVRRRSSGKGFVVGMVVAALLLGAAGVTIALVLGRDKEAPPQKELPQVAQRGPVGETRNPKAESRRANADTSRPALLKKSVVSPGRQAEPDKTPPVLDATVVIPAAATEPYPAGKSGTGLIPDLPPAGKQGGTQFIPGDVPAADSGGSSAPGFVLPAEPGGSGKPGFVLPLEIVDYGASKLAYKVRRLKLSRSNGPKHLRLAVTPPECDDMGKLLQTLGEGFQYTEISNKTLDSLDQLRRFDVVFLTCALNENWGKKTFKALRTFVAEGGTLYASDLRYNLVAGAFPEYAGSDSGDAGIEQRLEARIVNSDLKRYLGRSRLPLHFDMDAWQPAVFDPTRTLTLIEGDYRTTTGMMKRTPLLVKFRYGPGVVIFTSFHNAKQNSAVERKLLEYLVLALVNARSETAVAELMMGAGFSTLELDNQRATKGKPMPKATYRHQKGGFQIGVGFNDLGARLRLTLTAPDGQKIEHEENGTFLVEVPAAPAGTWRYQVTAVSLPFANFPYVVGLGKSSDKR